MPSVNEPRCRAVRARLGVRAIVNEYNGRLFETVDFATSWQGDPGAPGEKRKAETGGKEERLALLPLAGPSQAAEKVH